MYDYSVRQAIMAAKRQDLMKQAEQARAVRAARGERTSWLARARKPRPGRAPVPRGARPVAADAPLRPAEQPS